MSGRLLWSLLALALLAGCNKATTRPLEPMTGAVELGELGVVSAASVVHRPATGYDLVTELTLTWRGQDPLRIDLSRTMLRVDGMKWGSCRFPVDFDESQLIHTLQPGDVYNAAITCEDIARPGESVELRLLASGAGGTGVTELRFGGL